MLRNKTVVFLGLGILILLGAWYLGRQSRDQGAIQESAIPSPLPSELPSPIPSATSSSVGSESASARPLAPPSLEDVKAQVAKDPHHTPLALIQFAQQVSAKEEEAKKSPEKAAIFFTELEGCIGQKGEPRSVPVAAQTLCLTTAEELAKIYPDHLNTRLQTLQDNVPADTRKIRDALNKIQ